MVSKINTKPNTFYVRKDLDDAIGITPTYGDAYEGLAATFDLDSNPKTTYLIGESTVITSNDYVYGAGDINEMYVSTYTNTVTQTNPQTAPFIDVYNVHPNIDLTEGNMVIISGQTGQICTFSSWYDYAKPWLMEDFDGTEKHLFNIQSHKPPPLTTFQAKGYEMGFSTAVNFLLKIVRANEQAEGASGVPTEDSFLGLGIGSAIDSSIEWVGHEYREARAWVGMQDLNIDPREWGRFGVPFGYSGVLTKPDESIRSQTIRVQKKANGRYKIMFEGDSPVVNTHKKIRDVAQNEDFSLAQILAAGATVRDVKHITVGGAFKKTNFGEDYVAKATAANTIFSDIFGDAEVRDIKTMSSESPGDDPYFLAYGYTNLIVGDSYDGEQSLQAKVYWENFTSGTSTYHIGVTGTEAQDLANPFGRNATYGTPNTQDKVMSIHGIPQPYSFDLTRPNFSGSAFGPEIEIIFKINKMDVAPNYSGTAMAPPSTIAIERSFNIIGGATAPTGDENMLGEYADVMGEGQYWISFFNSGNSAGLIDVVGNNLSTAYTDGSTATDLGHIYYDNMSTVTGTAYHTQVSKGKWLTARIKFMQRSSGGGYDMMLYFPDELDSNGQMKFIELKNRTAWAPNQWFNHLTLWQNNMRSINEVPTTVMASNKTHINNGYYADAVINDDKEVDVIIDSISFYGWGLDVRNSTVAMDTGDSDLLRIPSAYATPQSINADTGAAGPSGPVKISSENNNNIYGQITVPIATYVSIGYDNQGWTPETYTNSPASGSLFTKGHNLLLNDFSTTQPESIRPITLVSGTHFGSSAYGYPGWPAWWFAPQGGGDVPLGRGSGRTTVGTAATDNIRIGGFPNSVDRFTQKGLIAISGTTAASGGFYSWRRSGNPYVSANILNVEENGTIITVDNETIFDMPTDTEYVIEKWPGTSLRQNHSIPFLSVWGGVESMGYQGVGVYGPSYISGTAAKITATRVGSGKIKLNRSVLSTDDGDGDGNVSLIEYNVANPDFGLSTYIISPYKYWMVMAMVDVSGSDAGGWGSWWTTPDSAPAATATVYIDTLASIDDDSKFGLSGTAGTDLITYTFDTTTEGDTDDTTTIGIKNDTVADATSQMVTCINNVNTLSGSGISAVYEVEVGVPIMRLTQSVRGIAGNTRIVNGGASGSAPAGTGDSVGGMTFSVSGVAATSILDVYDKTQIVNGLDFVLRGATGVNATYSFRTDVLPDAGDTDEIGIKDLADDAAVAVQIGVAITNVNTASSTGISAVVDGDCVNLTQSVSGTGGNTTSDDAILGITVSTFGGGVDGVFTGGSDTASTTYPSEPIQNASVSRMPARGYANMVAVSGGGTEGTTFNESIFTDGIYANRWNISFWDPATSIVNLNTDYGFGSIANDDEATGVASAGGVGFMGHDYLLSGQNYINISNYVGVTNPKQGDDFNFLVKPTFTDEAFARYSINMNTDDATTNKLSVLYGLRDTVPITPDFNVFPVLEPARLKDVGANIQAGDANVRFTWTEQDDDVWYRLLFVDNKNISNKYHNINFWAPLNETGSSDPVVPDYGFYTSQTDTTATSFSNSGSVLSDVEGFTGYAAKFDGTDDYLIGASHTFASAASKWSFIVHCKPSAASGGIFDVWSTTSKFKIEISSNRIKVTEAGSSKTLTSVNSYDADGFQPLAIVVTFDKDVKDNNWKLIVNGKLEDTEDYTSAISIAGTVFIGASGTGDATTGANFFTGFIEEITSYEETTVYIPPNENNYLLNTSGYPDLTTGSTNTSLYYTGRLFVMDYHNIRGKGPHDVGRTDMASWKVTGI